MITCNISNKGIRKASVLPLPVTASAATSLPFNNNGMQAAYKYNRLYISVYTIFPNIHICISTACFHRMYTVVYYLDWCHIEKS